MYIIEPCCAAKDLMILRDVIGKNGKKQFEGYGDLSLTELLPAILTRYSLTELMIVAPTVPDQAATVISTWMKKQWACAIGTGKIDTVKHATIVADFSEDVSPEASLWLTDNPFGERLTLVDCKQDDTVILLPDMAITGPVNMRYGNHFTATVTTIQDEVDAYWKHYTTSYAADTLDEEDSDKAAEDQEEQAAQRKKRKRKR